MESREKCHDGTTLSTNFAKASYQMHPISIFDLDIYADVSERDVRTKCHILRVNLPGFTSNVLQLAQAINHQMTEQYMKVIYM